MLDVSSLPTDRAGQEAWIVARGDALALVVRAALRRIVSEAWDSYTRSLTAGGELVRLDTIPDAWMTVVREVVVDELGESYLAGAITAWLGLNIEPSVDYAAAWEAVTNEAAVSYMGEASNRLAGVGDNVWVAVRGKVEAGVRDGLTNEQVKSQIEDVTSMSESRADTIARTETVGAYVQGDLAGAKALGADGPVEKVWVATLDRRTRDDHAAAHDQVQPMSGMFNVGGESMDAPHDPGASAEQVVNCRCYVEFLYPGDSRPDGSVVAVEDVDRVADVGPPGAVIPADWPPPADLVDAVD